MKKIISILLVALLVVSCMAMTAFASEGDGTYTINFTVNSESGFTAYEALIGYDNNVLELTDISAGALAGDSFLGNPGTAIASGYCLTGSIQGSGVLFTATFRVKDGAAPGTYNVTANFSVIDGEATLSGGSITIDKPECKHENTEIINKKDATCDAAGYTGDTYCNDCRTTITTGTEIPANGHKWDEGKVTTEPTCTEKGVRTYTCSVCGGTKTEEIKANGHKWDEGKVTTEPTCTEKGVKTYTCSVCGDTKTEDVDAKGHSYKWTKIDDNYHSGKCEDCGAVIEKEPHEYENNGYCECGAKKPGTKVDKDLDDVPKTGDITPMIVGAVVIFTAMAGAVVVIGKRKFVR